MIGKDQEYADGTIFYIHTEEDRIGQTFAVLKFCSEIRLDYPLLCSTESFTVVLHLAYIILSVQYISCMNLNITPHSFKLVS